MLATAMLVSARSPSIVMTLMPADSARLSGTIMAFGSLWEIMIASGFLAMIALTIAVCLATFHSGAPCTEKSTLFLAATDFAPQATVE